MSGKNRVFTAEFRIKVAQQIYIGTSVSALSQELSIKRSVLYRWRDAYRKDGEAGLRRPPGRPPGHPGQRQLLPSVSPLDRAQQRIAELERKIGQQELENDFLKRAFRHVEELRRKRRENGATVSTPRSGD